MLLSIDHGSKHVGLALASPQIKIAIPYKIISGENILLLFKNLKEIILKEKVVKIVIGYPIGLSGENSEQTKKTEKFIKRCRAEFNLPIVVLDERLTSKMADNLSPGKQNHAIAASIILQDYIDHKGSRHNNQASN